LKHYQPPTISHHIYTNLSLNVGSVNNSAGKSISNQYWLKSRCLVYHYEKMVSLLTDLFLFWLSMHCFVTCVAANAKNITTDQSSLLAFKTLITSDPYNILANNWSTSSSACSWVGVTCDERHGRVHSLNLNNMSLSGTVSPNLGNLSFLVILKLNNNNFSGQFPKEICQLHRLKVISIAYNEFVGRIPEMLGDLSRLQILYLGANNFSGFIPQSIGSLHQLKAFDFRENRLSGSIPQTILNMSSLEFIGLSSNYFSGTPSNFFILYSLRNEIYGKVVIEK